MAELTEGVLVRLDAAQQVALLRPPAVADPIRSRELVREATRGLRFAGPVTPDMYRPR